MGTVAEPERVLYEEYRRGIEGEPLARSLRIAVFVLFVIQTVFILVDWLLYPELFSRFLPVRLVLNGILALIYFGTSRNHPLASTYATCFSGGAMLLTVVHGTGGAASGYYVGLVLLFTGIGVLSPLTGRQSAFTISILFGAYLALPLVGERAIPWQTFGLHLFFLLAAGFEGVMSCVLLDRMRFSDFKQRREIERARDELKQLDREKSRFTANVHHELRTPLTLMLAPLEGMLSGAFGEVSGAQRQYLRSMHVNGLRLLKLINNLLDLAKIEGKQLKVTRRPLQIGPVMEDLAAGARPLAERKGVELLTHVPADLPVVHLDQEAIEKVIVNLVGNALKFTDRGGRIEIRAGGGSDGGIRLVVSDTGAGIPPDQLERIFDRFAQVDSSSTRRHEGTGIGLALVKELVELHGGRIWAESEGLGHGARIHVELPVGEADAEADEDVLKTTAGDAVALGNSLAAMEGEIDVEGIAGDDYRLAELRRNIERGEAAARPTEAPTGPAHPPDTPEVLIVEDNADMRRLLAHLVGEEFRVRVARNGRDGLERARESAPDLILTDVMMPEMSGTELCRAIKEDPDTRGIPVVLVTSKAEREMKIEGLELGADDYVTKPFHPRELLARVRSLVRLRRLQEELTVRNALLESTNEELKSTLAELKEAGSQLVQAERLAAVGELAAGVAHEVNNPVNFATNALSTLRSYVEDLRRVATGLAGLDRADPERLRAQLGKLEELRRDVDLDGLSDSLGELVAIACEGLERTSRLVGDLRDFAVPGEARRGEVDVGRGLRSTLQLLNYAMRQARIEVRLEIAPDLPRIPGDTRALNQVFLNLLKNAAEALESTGGCIGVEARREERWIVVTVRDDGPGIAAEERAHLFEPFYSTKGAGRGTGLGLSISRRIVNEHGGAIEVASEPGRGSAFTVRLPVGGAGGAA